MGLYDRDYTQEPTPDEIDEYKAVSKQEVSKDGRRIGRVNMPHLYPEAIRHHQSLFPNYHVDLISTKMNPDFDNINKGFLDLLDNPETHEQLILNYIKSSKAYHIPMSILRAGGFLVGNHGSYLFPEFELGQSYRADYLLVGKNSGGYQFIFVEFENPYNHIVLKDGELGETFRKGITQVKSWSRWLEKHYSSLIEFWSKNALQALPNEFVTYDSTNIHFVVVAWRRSNFNAETYRLRREYQKEQNITLLHYDNLYDAACKVKQYSSF